MEEERERDWHVQRHAINPEHQPVTHPDAGPENEMCLAVSAWQADPSLSSCGLWVLWFNKPLLSSLEKKSYTLFTIQAGFRLTSGSSGLALSGLRGSLNPVCQENGAIATVSHL